MPVTAIGLRVYATERLDYDVGMSTKDFPQLTLNDIDSLRKTLLTNAADLIDEAELLRSNGRHARAFSLSVIANEEAAKIPILLKCAESLLAGVTPDWPKLHKALSSHSAKLRSNLHNFKELQSPSKVPAVGTQEWKDDLERVERMNRLKQTGLYGDFDDSGGVAPAEHFDEEKAADGIQLAKISYNTSDLMGRGFDANRAGQTQVDLRLRYEM